MGNNERSRSNSGRSNSKSRLTAEQKALLQTFGGEIGDYKKDRWGSIILDEGGRPIKKDVADLSKIAPTGRPSQHKAAGTESTSTANGSASSSANKGKGKEEERGRPKRKKFLKESDKYRMGITRPESYWQESNRERLPYILDEYPTFHPVITTTTAPDGTEIEVKKMQRVDGRRYVGRAETSGTGEDEQAWVALVFKDMKVYGVPVHKEYKFELKRSVLEIGEKEAEDIVSWHRLDTDAEEV